jgi:beta-lactamase superfamily II metal-dependent hydrolase
MSTVFSVEMLPASEGDCLWIEYGDAERPTRILIDGGTSSTFRKALLPRIEQLPEEDRRFELLVVTHVDTDHIGGVLQLLEERPLGVNFGEVWFNAWRHIEPAITEGDRLGPIDGEILSVLLDDWQGPWNTSFGEGPAVVRDGSPLPEVTTPGGMKLTLLSPGPQQLVTLRNNWEQVVRAAGLEPGVPADPLAELARKKGVIIDDRLGEEFDIGRLADEPYTEDPSPANGATIAMLAEFGGACVLLAGDAYSSVLRSCVARLIEQREAEALPLTAFKLPHHGSQNNLENGLLDLVRCDRYLFSTNGAKFDHPDDVAVARVLTHGGRNPQLVFNYRTERSLAWNARDRKSAFEYKACYPAEGSAGFRVDLLEEGEECD